LRPLWLIRCDANAEVGLGHLGRCLAVAEALREAGSDSLFVGRFEADFAAALANSGFAFSLQQREMTPEEDSAFLEKRAVDNNAVGILVDGYRFDTEWLRRLSNAVFAPVLIDDFGTRGDYSLCRGIVNFTVGASEISYAPLEASQLLLGPSFFAARKALTELRLQKPYRKMARPERLLVCLGGTASPRLLQLVLFALAEILPDCEVRLLAPAADTAQISASTRRQAVLPICDSLVPHFHWADACISGGGLIKYECAYLGLPVGIISLNPSQQKETVLFSSRGLGYDLGNGCEQDLLKQNIKDFCENSLLRQCLSHQGSQTFPADAPEALAKQLILWTK